MTIQTIQHVTADYFGISVEDLRGPKRTREFVRPRQIAMVLSVDILGKSLPLVGRHFNRDHTTVLHAQKAVAKLPKDNRFARAVCEVRNRVNQALEREKDLTGIPVFIRHDTAHGEFRSRRG